MQPWILSRHSFFLFVVSWTRAKRFIKKSVAFYDPPGGRRCAHWRRLWTVEKNTILNPKSNEHFSRENEKEKRKIPVLRTNSPFLSSSFTHTPRATLLLGYKQRCFTIDRKIKLQLCTFQFQEKALFGCQIQLHNLQSSLPFSIPFSETEVLCVLVDT